MRVELLVGMIASGKSTYARRRAAEGAIIICDDAVKAALHGVTQGVLKRRCNRCTRPSRR